MSPARLDASLNASRRVMPGVRWTDAASESQMSIFRFIFITLGAGLLFGLVFWIGWGHRLHYGVYANDEFWYAEEFTNHGKVIITSVVSLAFGVCVSAVVWIIRRKREGVSFK